VTTSTVFPARSSVLSESALRRWVADAYDLPEEPTCQLISLSLNDVYLVTAGDKRSYLRVYRHGMRTAAEVAAELEICNSLAEQGLPIAIPIARRDGTLVAQIDAAEGPRCAVLWREADGADVREITTHHARAYGRLAAQIHVATDEHPCASRRQPLDTTTLIDAPLAIIRASLPDDPNLAELEQVAGEVRARLELLPCDLPDYGICHGDLHPGNVRFAADGAPTLFDFDCCGPGWRGYDLAVFLWNSYGERRPKRWRDARWRAFLVGYSGIRPLPAHIETHLADFLIARQIWLTGLDFAGQSGYPPQWVGSGLLRSSLTSIRAWRAEFATSSVQTVDVVGL